MLRKRDVIHMHGIPIGTAEVVISDGGMIFISNVRISVTQPNAGLITDQMDFGEGAPKLEHSDSESS